MIQPCQLCLQADAVWQVYCCTCCCMSRLPISPIMSAIGHPLQKQHPAQECLRFDRCYVALTPATPHFCKIVCKNYTCGHPISNTCCCVVVCGGLSHVPQVSAASTEMVIAHVACICYLQVSFNHEKRREWEKPVLEDINTQRAGQGLPPVDKLTIQVNDNSLHGMCPSCL